MVVTMLAGRYDRGDMLNEEILLTRILPALEMATQRAP